MIDLLFVELGAVVAELQSPTSCTFLPFCNVAYPPDPSSSTRIPVDFTRSLGHVLTSCALDEVEQQVMYDEILGAGRTPIGPTWPGGGYEGIISILSTVVANNPTLSAAVSTLDGYQKTPWRYQVIASIADDKTVRRYHGFQATVTGTDGPAILLEIGAAPHKIKYVPTEPGVEQKVYTGDRVAGNLLHGTPASGSTGAVFLAPTAFTTPTGTLADDLPKLPPNAGL